MEPLRIELEFPEEWWARLRALVRQAVREEMARQEAGTLTQVADRIRALAEDLKAAAHDVPAATKDEPPGDAPADDAWVLPKGA